jgi:hypothetical protein
MAKAEYPINTGGHCVICDRPGVLTHAFKNWWHHVCLVNTLKLIKFMQDG